ncbi:rhamnogalacturonan acetylesterase [bacterium]|nr:rhamnogalacturonan acetylesterase [bacterium]
MFFTSVRLWIVPLVLVTSADATTQALRFDFGPNSAALGWTAVSQYTLYNSTRGYGLVSANGVTASTSLGTNATSNTAHDALAGNRPFSFAVDLPEGNYDVTLQVGDPAAPADTTVKAETRRLMVESLPTATGEVQTRTFTVNIRTPALPDGRSVSLKPRERGVAHWDQRLTLEFNGAHPAVASIEIQRNDDALTIYLAGDSTVTDQPGEPWAAWGQMLTRFFPAGVAIANHAESGLSLASFRNSNRLEKILSTLKPGDYVFIQFGHNDMKEKGEGVGPFTTYAADLRSYVDAIRAKGGKPVLVTSMYRRRFDQGRLVDTLGDYPVAVRQVSKEKEVPLIDLHEMSRRLITALGPEQSKLAFVHFPAGAYPGQDKDVKDDTHFSAYGAYSLARCIVEGIRAQVPSLALRLAPDIPGYNPDLPSLPASFALPPSPPASEVRIPDGDGR